MYSASNIRTPDPKFIPKWMKDYESPGGPTDGAMVKNRLASGEQPGPELTKRKGRS